MTPRTREPSRKRQAGTRRFRTGLLKQCSKIVLVTAAYQIFVVGMEPVNAQDPSASMQLAQAPSVEGICVAYTTGGGGGGGGGGGCWGCQGYTGPSAAEVAAQQRQQEATFYNDRGVQLFGQEKWQLAIDAFTAALRLTPNDATMQKNLANAKQMLAREQAHQKQVSYDRLLTKMRFSGGRNDYGGNPAPKEVKSGADGGLGLKDLRLGDRSGDHDKPSPPAPGVARTPPFADPDARDAVADIPATVKALKEAVRTAPNNPSLLAQYAKALADSGDYRGAEEVLRTLLALDPKDQAVARLVTAMQERQKATGVATPTANTPNAAPTHVLTPFPQPGNRVPGSVLNTSDEEDKAKDPLNDNGKITVQRFRPTHPAIDPVPKELKKTVKWQQLEQANAKLQEEKKEIESKIHKLPTARSLSIAEQKAEEELQKDLLRVEDKIAKTEAKAQEWIADPLSWNDLPAPAKAPPPPALNQEVPKP